jgi:hypothetical protein
VLLSENFLVCYWVASAMAFATCLIRPLLAAFHISMPIISFAFIVLSFHSFCVVYIHFVFISFMVFMCGSSVMHGAFRVRAVAAIMLSAIEVLYLWRISADAFAI